MKFILLGTQRTGSSALAEGLALHSQVACGWEWTQHIRFRHKLKVMEDALMGDFSSLALREKQQMLMQMSDHITHIGFRRLFRSSDKWRFQPQYCMAFLLDRLAAHRRWLAEHPDVFVIHVIRQKNVDWLASKALAKQSGMYFGQAYPRNLQVSLDLKASLRRVRAKCWLDDRLSELSDSNPYCAVCYEDFLADNEAVIQQVLNFLDLPVEPLAMQNMQLRPQTHRPLPESISNYNELTDCLTAENLLRYDA